jgi:3-oxoacyl-[acyl-carrier protein] reductase
MNNGFDLTGKSALVTGGSRGIGAGIVRALAARGARCVINYVDDRDGRNRADAESLASELQGALLLQCDVGDPTQVGTMMEQIRDRLGGLDILVNNAGILRDRTLKKITPDDWNDVLRINLSGVFNCIRSAVPLLRPQGRIVNIASVSAYLGVYGQANYASAKAGVIALTKVTARELAKQNITVNAVAPGVIDTDMTRALPPEALARLLEQIPLARFGSIEDVVQAVMFLCSPACGYVTGQVIHVNGGLLMP